MKDVQGDKCQHVAVSQPLLGIINALCFVFLSAEKLYNSNGRDLRRALFSLKQIFQVTHCKCSKPQFVVTGKLRSSFQLSISLPVFALSISAALAVYIWV